MLAGDLDYQDFKRLPREDEAVVLRTQGGAVLALGWFISAFQAEQWRRERKDQPSHPSVLVTYRFGIPPRFRNPLCLL